MKDKISILLPTRKRSVALEHSISSLLELADDCTRIEFCIGIDDDDQESIDYVYSKQFKNLTQKHGCETQISQSKPHGYLNLFVYVNNLGNIATGNMLMFWNDDAEMLTKGWDTVILNNKNYF